MDYDINQKNLDKADLKYVDVMNGTDYAKSRALIYGASFLVAPISTGFFVIEDLICGKPTYSIETDSTKSSVIKTKRNNSGVTFIVPYLCVSIGLGFLLNDVDKNIAEQFECNKLSTQIENSKGEFSLENIVNSCSYEVYKNLENKFFK